MAETMLGELFGSRHVFVKKRKAPRGVVSPGAADIVNLAAIDLNLLVVLDALLEERHVTRAAQRVGLSQPAMSNALGRLRRLLDDPILVRAKNRKLTPTVRARALAEPLRRILTELREVLVPTPAFEPKTARRAFTIVTNDYVQSVIGPPLVARFAKEAPGVDLVLRTTLRYTDWDSLVSGEADAAILPVGNTEVPHGLHRMTLFVDPMVSIVRADHPRVGKRLTMKTFLALSHLKIAPSPLGGRSTLDKALASIGARRRIGLHVAFFNVAPLVVARSDLVATLPSTLARAHAGALGLRMLTPPLALPPAEHSLFWHSRTERSPEHCWLREQIVATASQLVPR